MLRRSQWSLLPALLLLLGISALAGCAPASPAVLRGEGSPSGAHNDTSTPFNLVSLPALIRHEYDGRRMRIGPVIERDLAGTRHRISYLSGDLELSGRLAFPHGTGPFPLVVLAHGYEDPATYRSGMALAREESLLLAEGYAVATPDYRNHAGSDRDGSGVVARPLGYAEDVVNVILALEEGPTDSVDLERVGVLGRSMGGGVALAAVAARPDLVDALVLYAPVSSSAVDTYRRWVLGRPELDARVRAAYGTPISNRPFWFRASVRNYLGRVDVPVQLHHGTADTVCPPRWSRTTAAALERAGQSVEHFEYPGEGHRFGDGWGLMGRRMVEFFDAHV